MSAANLINDKKEYRIKSQINDVNIYNIEDRSKMIDSLISEMIKFEQVFR